MKVGLGIRRVFLAACGVALSGVILLTFSRGEIGFAHNCLVYTLYAGPGNEEIFTINLDGSDRKRLTNNTANDSQPAFSPDGKMIVYYSDIEPGGGIFVMDFDGSGKKCISRDKGDFAPTFFPNGKKIACLSRGGKKRSIYVMTTDGRDRRRLTPDYIDAGYFAFTSDGKRVIFNGDANGEEGLYIINSDGSGFKRLINHRSGFCEFAVSRDGKSIAYSVLNSGHKYIITYDNDGNPDRMLSAVRSYEERPSFTPDGKSIVFHSLALSPCDGIGYSVSIVGVDGKGRNKLTDSTFSFYEPRISPDGRYITYGTTDIGDAEILVMNIDGSGDKLLCPGNPETVRFAPMLIDGRLLDYYGHWHEIDP